MNLKWIFGGAGVAIVLAFGWRAWQAGPLRAVWTEAPAPAAIVFDNGSVRDLAPASAPASAVVQALALKGGMRKCVRRSEVIYTDRPCPHGMSEQGIDRSRFNVVGDPGAR